MSLPISSIAARLTVALSLAVFILAGCAVAIVGSSLRAKLEDGLSEELLQSVAGWRNLLKQEGRVVLALASGAVANPTLREALASEKLKAADLELLVREEKGVLDADLLAFTDSRGDVRASTVDGLAQTNLVFLLPQKEASLLTIDGQPFWAVAAPVERKGKGVVGYLVLGMRLDGRMLERLAAQGGGEFLLHRGEKVLAEKLRSVPAADLLPVLAATAASEPALVVSGTRLRVARVDVGDGLELVVAREVKEELVRFRSTLTSLAGLGAVATVLIALLTFLLARRVTGPLRKLIAIATRVVDEGDFSETLVVRSNDEVGVLTASFSRLMEKQRSLLLALRGSAQQLEAAAREVSDIALTQNGALSLQAAAVQEIQVTARQLEATSRAAAVRATDVLEGTARADALGRSGQEAVTGSLGGLKQIREQVEQFSETIRALSERTVQIGTITETVKDLAVQSNMLALNASIEAVRSGEHGKGFSVVAREIRSLADQSVRATARTHEVLDAIGQAIGQAVQSSESGAREVEGGLLQVQTTGESLRALAEMMQGQADVVRAIAKTVGEQDDGIRQIFTAVSDLSSLSNSSLDRVSAAEQAAENLAKAAREVSALVSQYKL